MFEDYTMFKHTVVAGWSPRGDDSMLQALKREQIGSLPIREISGISMVEHLSEDKTEANFFEEVEFVDRIVPKMITKPKQRK